MINLHERLSEFSFGYGVTREVQILLESVGLRPTPFLPSLLHEAELGFDVGFQDRGRVVVLQFKLGDELRRFHRAFPAQAIPDLHRPFWRFTIDTSGHQFQRLTEFESNGAETYYVAPRFSHWSAFEQAFQDEKVLEKSLLVKPSEIAGKAISSIGAAGTHRIVYDRFDSFVCSEPVHLDEHRPDTLATAVAERIRSSKTTLRANVRHLYERERVQQGPGELSKSRRKRLFDRAKDQTHGMAAVLGLEAWSQGAQMIYVTDPST